MLGILVTLVKNTLHGLWWPALTMHVKIIFWFHPLLQLYIRYYPRFSVSTEDLEPIPSRYRGPTVPHKA